MTSTDPVVRVLRLMTHLNLGAALGMVAWILWSGYQLVTGRIAPPQRPPAARAAAVWASAQPAPKRAPAAAPAALLERARPARAERSEVAAPWEVR